MLSALDIDDEADNNVIVTVAIPCLRLLDEDHYCLQRVVVLNSGI
jgi:hypothetical protein